MAYRKRSRSSVARRRRAPARRMRARSYKKKRSTRIGRQLYLPFNVPPRAFVGLTWAYDPPVYTMGAQERFLLRMASSKNYITTHTSEPQGFDAWKFQYYNYRVVGMKIRIKIVKADGNADNVVSCRSYCAPEAASVLSSEAELANRWTKNIEIGNQSNQAVFRWYMKPHNVLGMSRAEYHGRDDTMALCTEQPVLRAFCYLVLRNLTTAPRNIRYMIQGKTYFEFLNPVTQVDSV